MVISRIRMMKAGGVFYTPSNTMFKRKKSKHKKKVSNDINTSHNPSSSSSSNGDEDWLVVEILTRLPVKSLIRFKSVCKNWSSLIQEDQHFIDLHLTRSKTRHHHPRIFIVVPLPRTKEEVEDLKRLRGARYIDSWPFIEFHITADLLFEEEEQKVYNNNVPIGRGTKLKLVVDTVRKINSTSHNTISKPLNGLICLIDQYIKPGARIRNICTGQLSPWFHSSLRARVKYGRGGIARNGFGFDPATNKHKLVLVWKMKSGTNRYICEVLTIGHQGNNNNRWRQIEDVPRDPDVPWGDSVYANGVIYWSTFSLQFWEPKRKYSPICLVAFDVGSEKFRTITVPDFILDQSGNALDKRNYFGENVKLFELDGNLAIVFKLKNCTFKMYIYDDHVYKDKEEDITNGTSSNYSSPPKKDERWSEVNSITLPFRTGKYDCVNFHTFVGSRDKILVTVRGPKTNGKWLSIYCYNWKNGSWVEVDVSGIPSSVPELCSSSFSTTFFDSLLSLNNHTAL